MGTSTAPDITSGQPDSEVGFRPDRFRKLMAKRRATTTAEQADLCGLPRTHLADILALRKEPKVPTAIKLARGSGGTVEYLFGADS